eukprot:SAG31_NODE_11004_length_1074_cov_1.434872_1_plen_104_part_10
MSICQFKKIVFSDFKVVLVLCGCCGNNYLKCCDSCGKLTTPGNASDSAMLILNVHELTSSRQGDISNRNDCLARTIRYIHVRKRIGGLCQGEYIQVGHAQLISA